MSSLPMPSADAPLPQRYEAAKVALSECARVDECKEWADRAEALKSYARQADDDTLYKTAIRIQSRAIRRAGELLKEFQNERARTDLSVDAVTQRKAAAEAGMSKRQEVTARRIAEIPEDDFEELVDGEDPPTVTELADKGRKVIVMKGWSSPTMKMARWWFYELRDLAERCAEDDPRDVAAGVMPTQRQVARDRIETLKVWIDELQKALHDE